MRSDTWWLDATEAASLFGEGTTAFRIATGQGFWIEYFGGAALVSTRDNTPAEIFLSDIERWSHDTSIPLACVYLRRLVTGPGANDTPLPVAGNPDSPKRIVSELSLRYEVDFSLGYNPGLFTDQRANKAFLAALAPRRLLNTFAHTCAFSVVAAAHGAETVSVDISKSSLARGRRNFELNSLDTASHRFVAEDVPTFLRRLAKRGETFDAIILDPPTFGRGGGGKTFRFERDFPQLLSDALAVSRRGASLLLSTNCSSWNDARLEAQAHHILPSGTRYECAQIQADHATGSPSSTLWATLP